MRQEARRIVGAMAIGLLGMTSGTAHSTSCGIGLGCDLVSIETSVHQLSSGAWRYDYTLQVLSHVYYDPLVAYEPISIPARLVALSLPYFADSCISYLNVGSDYAGQLTVTIENQPVGGATQSIVVADVGRKAATAVLTQQPTEVMSGVNTLLSFTSPYAPVVKPNAAVSMFSYYQDSPDMYERYYNGIYYEVPTVERSVRIPGSPQAVGVTPTIPEPDAAFMALAGMAVALWPASNRQKMVEV